jgi:APA family basic amino acid/polyamine antiporter
VTPSEPPRPTPRLGLWSGIGVNIGTMIGTGVFVSAGFMADTMSFGLILLAWLVGGMLAMAGARAYAAVAELVPRSGGEYRYLSDLVHPWLGYLAGWTSLLAGFSMPVATSAGTAGPFAATLIPGLDPRIFAAGIIVAVTLLHALDLGVSKVAQDALAWAKVVLIVGFIVVGLVVGYHGVPGWTPLHTLTSGRVDNFMSQLVYVMYAYSGWNSAVYAAEEFKDPKRTVPRSMVIGALLVMIIYLLVNWVLGANLTQATVTTFLHDDRSKITLGHLVTTELIGPTGGLIMSILVVVALVSSVSAMTLVGPRVYAAMARDGFLPRIFAARGDAPPLFSVLLQGALALVILYLETLEQLIRNVGVILTLTSALTVAALFKVRLRPRPGQERPGLVPLACAAVFIAVTAWMLYSSPQNLLWPVVITVVATVAYILTRLFRR